MKRLLAPVLILLFLAVGAFAQNNQLLVQRPTINQTHVVFDYAGDLWRVPKSGGTAERLTSGVGLEGNAIFSPDGKWLTFRGEYDGNTDVFVMPAEGGDPRRITYHPSQDVPIGWSNDGKSIIFLSNREELMPLPTMFSISVSGTGIPEQLPFPLAGGSASFSPDGSKIAYMPIAPAFAQWKLYRGGRTTKIWIGNMSDSAVTEIPRSNSNDFSPVWLGNKIYFLSDRNGKNVTLYSYDTSTRAVKEEIKNQGLDLKSLDGNANGIVFEQFGGIYSFDPKTGRSQNIPVSIRGDFPEVRPKYVRVGQSIANATISPNGKRAVFEARGEIISVPVENGDARNLTNSSGVADRDPAWSPDGKWIAYFSDESGEYALHLRDQSGVGETRKISLGNPSSYFYSPKFSPDGKSIAFTDKRLNIWILSIENGAMTKVDTNTYENPFRTMSPEWSPDSKWLVYCKQMKNRLSAVHVYSVADKKSTLITDSIGDARGAVFDRGGKYIYFVASTNSGPTSGWLDMSSFPFQVTRSAYAIVLDSKDPSPLAPESDEEKVKDPNAKPEAPQPKKDVEVKIDFEGIGQRIVDLPMPARDYGGVVAATPGSFYISETVPASGTGPSAPGVTIHKFDFSSKKAQQALTNIVAFDVSYDGTNMLYSQFPGRWTIAPTNRPIKPGDGALNTNSMEVFVKPREEWDQMYREAWRIQRDFFYDPGFHGNNLKTLEARYRPYLANIVTRNDLNYLFREMLGNLTIGHHNSGGGDSPNAVRYSVGLLGADYAIDSGRYKFRRIFNGENWNPGNRAPLTEPGLNVKEGEYIIAVNGREVTSKDNLYSFFEQTANKQVQLKIGSMADGSDARTVTVVPVASERNLRGLTWIENNRRRVEELSGGRLAYLYLPNTGGAGYTNFNRYYFAQIDKQGAVVDERFNGGGTAADYIVDYLSRPLMNYWSTREGADFTTPVGSIYGPKTMIINEYAGSGGDLLPWLFREAKVGQLVGMRTWGGLVGIYDYPALIDGGGVSAPRVAFRNRSGELDVENKGVAPDIETDLDPAEWRKGRDTQLEKAVEVTLKALEANPMKTPPHGPFPKYPKP
ncbi:MAG: PDZ domain-containing protein [Pyrinomonadaceae bacterium]